MYFKKLKFIIPFLFLIITITNLSLINVLGKPNISHHNHIIFYDNNNQIIKEEINELENKYVEIEQINKKSIECFISIEDKNFYNHLGIDISRIFKSLIENINHQDIMQGGSTITQQLSKNIFFDNSKTIDRKLKEIFMAFRIEHNYSKEEIIEAYLNSIYFGHGIYGIESASNYYFNKKSIDLSIAETALLIGIINAPSTYSPFINYEKSIEKQTQILNLLKNNNTITMHEYNEALNEKLNLDFSKKTKHNNALSFYVSFVKHELEKLNIETKNGIKIYTNYDSKLNNYLNYLVDNTKFNNKDSNLSIQVSIPYSNKLIAAIGGKNYLENSFNCTYSSSRQIGSTIKPFIYYLGLKKGMTILTALESTPTTFFIKNFGYYNVKNNNDLYAYKKINMLQAIAMSDNIYAIKTGLLVGSDALEHLFNSFNYSYNKIPSSFLGTSELTNIELLNMYNTLASEGLFYPLRSINKITSMDGNLLYLAPNSYTRVLDKNTTIVLNKALTSTFDKNIKGYTSPSLLKYKPNAEFSAKTGSTYSDNYVMGFNPEYTIGIWVGNNLGEQINEPGVAKSLFKDIANSLTNKNSPTYSKNLYILAKKIDPNTGLDSSNGSMYYFLR